MAEETTFRDEVWLADRVRLLRQVHFTDVPQGYPIVTRFGSRARYRFGSIAARNGETIILVNRLFADPRVPDYVVDGTLAHELAHYAHGFGSGLPRLYQDAHRGGVVDKELERRGLGEVNAKAETWRKMHWDAFHASQCTDIIERSTAKTDHQSNRWQIFHSEPNRRSLPELNVRLLRIEAHFIGRPAPSPPFQLAWLEATRRQKAPSYWYAEQRTLRLHGVMADRRVPDEVIDFELAYWRARLTVGSNWKSIHALIIRAGLEANAAQALDWRKRRWESFQEKNHPLK